MRKKGNKVAHAVLLAGSLASPAIAQQNATFVLKKNESEFALLVEASPRVNQEWLEHYAKARGLQLYTANPLSLAEGKRQVDAGMAAIANELQSLLGSEVKVQITNPNEMTLAVQAGGQPGRVGQ